VAPGQPRIEGAGLDFRDEIMAQIYDRGDVRPKRTLTFNIDVTDDGETRGPSFRERRTFRNWRRIGTITFDRAVVSYNGGLLQPNKIKLLVWPTILTALIERKSFSGALANRSAGGLRLNRICTPALR
jgi:hypothetical protein